jgi:hypothetical protein
MVHERSKMRIFGAGLQLFSGRVPVGAAKNLFGEGFMNSDV